MNVIIERTFLVWPIQNLLEEIVGAFVKLFTYVCELLYQNLQIYHLPSDSDLLFFQKHPLQFDENDDVWWERIVLFV